MKPKEKAKQLVKIFQFETEINEIIAKFQKHKAKQCALIAVDEILKCHIWKYNSIEPYKYWQEVKHKIEKL